MNPLRLQRETIFSISSVVLASAIRGKSVLKGDREVKKGGIWLHVGKTRISQIGTNLEGSWQRNPLHARLAVHGQKEPKTLPFPYLYFTGRGGVGWIWLDWAGLALTGLDSNRSDWWDESNLWASESEAMVGLSRAEISDANFLIGCSYF
jgi:hypothetical protein